MTRSPTSLPGSKCFCQSKTPALLLLGGNRNVDASHAGSLPQDIHPPSKGMILSIQVLCSLWERGSELRIGFSGQRLMDSAQRFKHQHVHNEVQVCALMH